MHQAEEIATDAPPPAKEPMIQRFLRFLRSIAVGAFATGIDFLCMEILHRGFEVRPSTAKIPAFLLGVTVQFFGNRRFTFRAQSADFKKQIAAFLAVESISLFLNWFLIRLLVEQWSTPMEIANFAVSFVVYTLFSYQAWKRVFKAG
jgi:putative flippase GtrA